MEKEITPINKLSWSDKLKSYTKHPGSFVLLLLVSISAVLTVTVLIYLVGYILIHGVPYLKPELFSFSNNIYIYSKMLILRCFSLSIL